MSAWRVMTWNLLGSGGVLTEEVAEAIRDRHPDAVALQEIRHRQARRLARHLGWHYRWTLKHFPYSPVMWWRAEGMAILSPHHLHDLMHATISDGFWTWNYRRRVLMGVTIANGIDRLRLFNTHLGGSAAERRPQARRIAARLEAESTTDRHRLHFVLAGDLNAANDPATLDPLLAIGMVDPGGTNSSPAADPYQRIDYVLIPESSTSVVSDTPHGGREWDRLSDHLPVVVAFTVSIGRAAP